MRIPTLCFKVFTSVNKMINMINLLSFFTVFKILFCLFRISKFNFRLKACFAGESHFGISNADELLLFVNIGVNELLNDLTKSSAVNPLDNYCVSFQTWNQIIIVSQNSCPVLKQLVFKLFLINITYQYLNYYFSCRCVWIISIRKYFIVIINLFGINKISQKALRLNNGKNVYQLLFYS